VSFSFGRWFDSEQIGNHDHARLMESIFWFRPQPNEGMDRIGQQPQDTPRA